MAFESTCELITHFPYTQSLNIISTRLHVAEPKYILSTSDLFFCDKTSQ